MSFWSTSQSSALDEVLSKENVSLLEVLDEPEVLQECKSQNKKLIDYLVQPDILLELISVCLREPEKESDIAATRYKYETIACEVLTCELPQIIDSISNEKFLLDKLYEFLEQEAPLNPLLASFFSRVMGVLVAKTSEHNWFSYQVSCLRVLEYLKSRENCIHLLLRHIGTSAIMDLILKMYTKIEGVEIRENFIAWLEECEFLEHLVALINPDSPADVVSNVCQLLCDLIYSSRENTLKTTDNPEQDRIIRKIESEPFITKILEQMFLGEPRCERSIVGGISVLLILLDNNKRDEYSASWDALALTETSKAIENAITAITPQLPVLVELLRNPPPKSPVHNTIGELNPPLGATRVELVRLLAALVSTGKESLLDEIQRLDLLNILLDLFFEYPWNNFLHTQVEATLVAALQYPTIATHIFTKCQLIQRILEAWSSNETQEKEKKPRRGYMGHLIEISNHVVRGTETPHDTVLADVPPDTLTEWSKFVGTALAKVNGDQNSGIAVQNKRHNDDAEQFYSEALAPSFADNVREEQQLGRNDTFGDLTEVKTLKPGFPNADTDDVLEKQAELFNLVCAQKLQSLDDDSDLWSSIIQTPSDIQNTRAWNDDGSSDEENAGGRDEGWSENLSSGSALDQSNPWSADVLSANSPPDPGWANFESSPFLANFGYELSSTIATSTPGDLERTPFDLTPTEVPMFPADEDWATDTLPPCEWPVSPSELQHLPDVEHQVDVIPQVENNSSTENQFETGTESPDNNDGNIETAQVEDSENLAEIVVAADFMKSVGDDPAEIATALPTNTVIVQMKEETAAELAKLLSEVSMASERNEMDAQGDCTQLPVQNNSQKADVKNEIPPEDNDEKADDDDATLVPKMTSKIAVKDDESLNPPAGLAPNDVTVI